MQTANKAKIYYDTQGRVLLTKEFCHHCRTLKSKNRLMSGASSDCDLKFCYECIQRYKPLLSYRRFLENLKTVKKMCLVGKDRCLGNTCESSNLLADEELVDLISRHNYDSKFLVDNKDLVNKLIDKKDIIKKNQWAIGSFVKNLSPEKLKDGTIEEPYKDQIFPSKELQTLDTLSSSSPINNVGCKLNEENVSSIISGYSEGNKIKDSSKNCKNLKIPDAKHGLDYTMQRYFREELNKTSQDYLKYSTIDNIPTLKSEMSGEELDSQCTPMSISLPFLNKAQSKTPKVGKLIESQDKGRRLKAIFKIQKP